MSLKFLPKREKINEKVVRLGLSAFNKLVAVTEGRNFRMAASVLTESAFNKPWKSVSGSTAVRGGICAFECG